MSKTARAPSFLDALTPTLILMCLLAVSVYLFGDSSSSGSNQIALILSAAAATIVGLKNGHTWASMEEGMIQAITMATRAMIILLMVGALIGSWILSGTVPSMVYFGLQFLDPGYFYAACLVISAFVALSIGSSWTVAGTIGIGLIGTAAAMGLPLEVTAGAIISGAYFGDKMSPLSDTTNLAPAVSGTDLFTHIRNMIWTTGPSIIIALLMFLVLGMGEEVTTSADNLNETLELLSSEFSVGVWALIPLFVVMILAFKKVPALPTIVIGAVVGLVFAVLFQRDLVVALANDSSLPLWLASIKGIWIALADGYTANTGNENIDSLLSRGGMSSMLNTISLILSAMIFGGVMDALGLLSRLVQGVLKRVERTGSLVAVTIASCVGANIITADQYIAIVLPGRMYRGEFARRGLAPKALSRVLEDSATITSPLIPWNTCGAFMAGTLGVATLAYLPYCFFNLINPLVSLIYGYADIKMARLSEEEIARFKETGALV